MPKKADPRVKAADIRSFFGSQNSSSSSSKSKNEVDNSASKKKRARVISSSDDDEVTFIKESPSKKEKIVSKATTKDKSNEKTNAKKSPLDVANFFGQAPIKSSTSKSKTTTSATTTTTSTPNGKKSSPQKEEEQDLRKSSRTPSPRKVNKKGDSPKSATKDKEISKSKKADNDVQDQDKRTSRSPLKVSKTTVDIKSPEKRRITREEKESTSKSSSPSKNNKNIKSPEKIKKSRAVEKSPSPTPVKKRGMKEEKNNLWGNVIKHDEEKEKKSNHQSSRKNDKSPSKNDNRSPSKSRPSTSKAKAEPFDLTKSKNRPIDRAPSTLWVDKYRPNQLKNIIGQGTDSSNGRKLVRWLQNWHKLHGSGKPSKPVYTGGFGGSSKDPEGKTFKAALLSGPPGIGKTTTAHLAVKEIGYDYFELNASDTRNKGGLVQCLSDAMVGTAMVGSGNKDDNKFMLGLAKRRIIIMDEVDGMSGNEDRGGIQELISLIKASKSPIICICNDRSLQKMRTLVTHCFELRFNKPNAAQLKSFISSLCFKEKIKVQPEMLQRLMTSTDFDIRQIIHQLQLFKESKQMSSFDPKKDLKFGPWDVCRKVFSLAEHKNMNIHSKMELFFHDYSIGPLFVQENYLKWVPTKAGDDKKKRLELIAKSAEAIATGDRIDNLCRKSQNWSLLPMQAAFSSYMPGEYMEGDGTSSIDFPRWLGKNSNTGKRSRLLQSMHTHMHLHITGSVEALNLDYLPYMRRMILAPLAAGKHEEASRLLNDYTMVRDDLDSLNELTLWTSGMKDLMSMIDTKTKTSFTRQLNKNQIQLPYSTAQAPTKGKGRGGGSSGETQDDLGGYEDEEINEGSNSEEDDKIEKDKMIKAKKRPAKTAAAKKKSKVLSEEEDDDFIEDSDEEGSTQKKKSKTTTTAKSRGKGKGKK